MIEFHFLLQNIKSLLSSAKQEAKCLQAQIQSDLKQLGIFLSENPFTCFIVLHVSYGNAYLLRAS